MANYSISVSDDIVYGIAYARGLYNASLPKDPDTGASIGEIVTDAAYLTMVVRDALLLRQAEGVRGPARGHHKSADG